MFGKPASVNFWGDVHLTVNVFYPGQEPPTDEEQELEEAIEEGFQEMSQQLEDVKREVAENRSATESAAALLSTLSAKITELKDDPEALAALAAELDEQTNALANAVAANTPASEEEPLPEA